MQDYWERKHEEELRRWEEVMRMPRYMNYVDRDDSVRLTQAFVDQLGSVMRNELDKLKVDINGQEVDLQAQVNRLKKDGFDAEKDRLETLSELERMREELRNSKYLDNVRSKYVYQTLLWDKLLDHKIRHPECAPDYKELDYVRKYLGSDRGAGTEPPAVPEWTKNAVKVDSSYINTSKIN